VVAAFDFNVLEQKVAGPVPFVAHRQILQQARLLLYRDQNFGELLVGPYQANRLEHLFCSVGMLANRRLWEKVGRDSTTTSLSTRPATVPPPATVRSSITLPRRFSSA
jgi:hypothetical protein